MWKIEYSRRFLKELSKLPLAIRDRIETIVFEELPQGHPFTLGYIEHLTGYSDKYKIRVKDHRIGLIIDKAAKILICQRVAHRKDIYRIFP
ncbi:MAG: type II toxin-antitoxin system RelE/ParE family toxin [Candidatus Omnitrophota bacterium]